MPHTLPSSQKLQAAYPNYVNSRFVKQMIGGGIDDTKQGTAKEWINNTCTVRISRAFNYAGAPISGHFAGLRTAAGKDRLRYAFAVLEFWKYMMQTYGKPQIDERAQPNLRAKFAGKAGVIGFLIHFGDADGHFDLWDGNTFFDEIYGISYRGHDFFDMATRVALWETQGPMHLPAAGR